MYPSQVSACSTRTSVTLAKISQLASSGVRVGEDHTVKGKDHGVGRHHLGPLMWSIYHARLAFVFVWRV